jgi:hypothetical protein
MRALLLTIAAVAGFGLAVLTPSPAGAITIAAPAGVRQAADGLRPAEPVHCRKYRHRHGHSWGLGCAAGPKMYRAPQSGVVAPSLTAPRPLGANPSNPQDRSGISNPQSRTTPRSINPQDMTR